MRAAQAAVIKRAALLLVGLLIAGLLLAWLSPPRAARLEATELIAARALAAEIAPRAPGGVSVSGGASEAARTTLARSIPASDQAPRLAVRLESERRGARLRVSVIPEVGRAWASAERRVGDWGALLPPLLAVAVALATRRVVLSLGLAVLAGGVIAASGDPLAGAWIATTRYLGASLTESFNLYVLGFTLALVGMVHVIMDAGGIGAALWRLRRATGSARAARMTTIGLGLALFFDDYANTVVVGSSMGPVADARRISREKLAYLVDSTSAPVAGIALISTWVGYEVGLFDELAAQLSLQTSGYAIFLTILPMRFYCLLTLVFVVAVAWTGRDFGPMARAESAASARLKPSAPDRGGDRGPAELTSGAHWALAAAPIALVLFCVFAGMYWSGWRGPEGIDLPGLSELARPEAPWGRAAAELGSIEAWREAFSRAENAKVLFFSALLGSAAAIALSALCGALSIKHGARSWAKTARVMAEPSAILILAWSMRAVCDDLGAAVYLVASLDGAMSALWFPLATFMVAAAVAFATGTSWGTMGILLPAIIPVVWALAGDQGPILWLCFAAVLDGAIFGDHCSPISDTTVMSSLACGCDHLQHVRTQAPYAIATMIAAAGFGYLGVALGLPVWAALLAGAIALIGALLAIGRAPPDGEE